MSVITAAVLLVAVSSVTTADDGGKASGAAGALAVTQVERIGTTRYRHGSAISQLWYPANDRLVSAGGLKIRLWDAESGELMHEYQSTRRSRLAFDGNRRVLVAEPLVNRVPTQAFHFVDLVSGQQISRWLRPEWTQSSVLSRSGKFAVLGLGDRAHTASLVDAQTGREIDRIARRVPRGREAGYPLVALSPDDRILALLARPNHVQFYELGAEGKVQRPLATIGNQSFHKLIFSSKREEVLLLGTRSSSIWNVRTRQLIKQWNEPGVNRPSDAVFDRQGRIVAELTDGIVRIRDTLSGKELRSFPLNTQPRCHTIALSPDDSVLAAGGYGERVRLFDFTTGKEIRFHTKAETFGPVESVAISHDGEWIASAEFKGEVSLWNRQDGWKRTEMPDDDIKSRFTYDTHAGPNFVTFLPGTAKLLSGSGVFHNSLNVWDAASARRDQRFVGHAMPVSGVATNRDGEVLASTSRDGSLRIWDRNGNQLHQIRAGAKSLSLSPDGSLVAVCLHREGPNRSRSSIPEPSMPVAVVELWSTKTGKLVRSLDEVTSEPYGFYSISLSHDGRHLAGIANDGLYVWDVATGKRTRLIPVPHPAADKTCWHAPNCGCAFSPTVNIIAVPTVEGSIVFLDVEAKADTPIAIVKGHDGPVNAVAWRRDGKCLVSGGNDSTIVVWRIGRSYQE